MSVFVTTSVSCKPAPSFIDCPFRRTVPPEPKVLLIEHRDEVFARLQCDLSQAGIGIYRATYPEEVFRVHARIPIELTISNSGLPQASLWLTTTKLRIQCPAARVWAYSTRPDRQTREWARLVGIEKMFSYGGDLLELTQTLQHAVREYWSVTRIAGDMLSKAS